MSGLRLFLAFACASYAAAFLPASTPSMTLRSSGMVRASTRCPAKFGLKMMADDETTTQPKRMGASIDADGKSNVWAVEPKIQVQEQTGNPILVPAIMAAGLVALLALLAVTPLTNPDQI